MKDINLLDCEGIKLWSILYFIWNMKFCKNRKQTTFFMFAHNFPTLHKTLFSFGYTVQYLEYLHQPGLSAQYKYNYFLFILYFFYSV